MSIFRIKDLKFNVVNAVFKGHVVDDQLFWSLSIEARYPGRFQGEEWRARAYCDNLRLIGGKPLNHWTDVLGQAIEWKDNIDKITGEPIAALCVFEHLDIYESNLRLGKAIDYNSFEVGWNGKCEVFFGDDYGRDLELVIQTRVIFEGVEVPFQGEKAEALFRDFIREGEFEFCPGDGKHQKPVFIPRK